MRKNLTVKVKLLNPIYLLKKRKTCHIERATFFPIERTFSSILKVTLQSLLSNVYETNSSILNVRKIVSDPKCRPYSCGLK